MKSNELREKFIKFFEGRGHKVIPSASLVPENDPSILFTTAGMHPLVPYLLGENHPLGKRLTNVQKCLRTDDIDEVGDSQHLTFFEMLGYWSLGDYFKKESIKYTFDFFIKILGFNKDDVSVTVFAGDDDAPFDEESYATWKDEIGIPENHIYKYPKKENWWGPVGETGPCGPDTEMFIDTGIEPCSKDCGPSCGCDKFVEIGNNVFMEYFKTEKGQYEKLKQKNVDVGLGFERLVMFSQSKKSVFEIDIFLPIIKKIEELSGKKYKDNLKEFRIIADHVRAAVFAINDGALPSNKGAGYIVRRLIRRAVVKANQLGIEKNFTAELAEVIFEIYGESYFSVVILTEVEESSKRSLDKLEMTIKNELNKEEDKFRKTLEVGLRQFEKTTGIGSVPIGTFPIGAEYNTVSGKDLFDLYQSFGFPLELSLEIAKNKKIKINNSAIEQFNNLVLGHQELSRTASAGMFKGGLADSGEEAIKYHTATHLLQQALRDVLGQSVGQKGSNINAERMRFDFTYAQKLTPEQIEKVEDIVNEKIEADLPVTMEEMSPEEAKESGAIGLFEHKYGDKVKVYSIDDFSKEICGGPHVSHTGELGHFKILKEESSSAGVRRIKAVLE